jgi:DNA-binding response OmpR family regulator
LENSIGIMVVEDDGLIQSLIEATLTEGGYQVSTASTAERAIELLDVQDPKYRALVTDVQLGSEKLTGWDIARRAREITADLPIVYVTGDSGPEWASQGVPNSILVAKPFAPAQLLTAVSQLMNLTAPSTVKPAE